MSGTPHYFEPDPGVASHRNLVHLRLPDVSLDLVADRGVFSHQGIDRGTDLLLREGPPPPPSGDLLDLGCGYGPIALTLARRSPGARIWAVDVNNRALELVRLNAGAARLENVVAARPEAVPPSLRFAALYSNPPVRVGKEELHRLLLTWLGRLEAGGRALLVVHRHLGSDSLARWLAGQGHAVERLRSRTGYRLLSIGTGNPEPPPAQQPSTPPGTVQPPPPQRS